MSDGITDCNNNYYEPTPRCSNCKHLIVREADDNTKKWGFDTEEYCGKYEKFMLGFPSMINKQDRMAVNADLNMHNCKYYRSMRVEG
jgi:hypothetical protein